MNLGTNGCTYNCGESCSGECLSRQVTKVESSNIVCELIEYKYRVTWGHGGNHLCWFIPDVDGYYHIDFSPSREGGTFSSHEIREIADALDVINKPWDDHINEYFKSRENINLEDDEFDDTLPF